MTDPTRARLSFVDWSQVATHLAATLNPLLACGGDHLLREPTLRAHTIDALIATGVTPSEIALDARDQATRIELWLHLDTGVTHAISLTHPRHQPRTNILRTALWPALQRAAHHPAHEHITIALHTIDQHAQLTGHLATAGVTWPDAGTDCLMPAQLAQRPRSEDASDGTDLHITCHAAYQVADHVLLLCGVETSAPAPQQPRQPALLPGLENPTRFHTPHLRALP